MAKDEDILSEEREAFELAADAANENRVRFTESLRFNRLGEQWPEKFKKQREDEGKPVLTLNHMPSIIRQVVNDARQNKPQIVVKPVSGGATKATANVMVGIIRNIEYQSKAGIAYDTGVDFAASGNVGYIRVSIEHEYDDTFDKCLKINAVDNPLSVYGDPNSTAADSADWNRAFVTDLKTKDEFKAQYKGAEEVDWAGSGYEGMATPWREDDSILVAESWLREKVKRKILMMDDGQIIGEDEYKANMEYFQSIGVMPSGPERMADSYKVTQRIMTGAEVLETNEWAGRYIPIVPVYGEVVNVEGKMHLFSLPHHAMDAQRMFNYWRSNATELAGLMPRAPYIGEEGAFDVDPEKWATVNTANHAYLEYAKKSQPPQRQPIDGGVGVTSLTQANLASDDIKAITGLYDASLGQRSNETSGKAINARKHEGDVSTFHFMDNLNRAICHVGCILVDLIPKVYSERQMVRIIGADSVDSIVKVGQAPKGQPAEPPVADPMAKMQPGFNPNMHPTGIEHVFDLTLGKFDVAVDTGPSYTTRREETAQQMQEFIRAFPAAAEIVGDLVVKAQDWPFADEFAERLKARMQPQGGLPPEVQQMIEQGKQHIQDLEQQLQQLTSENQQMKGKSQADVIKANSDSQKIKIDAYTAETARLTALIPYMQPELLNQLGLREAQDAMNSPDIAPGPQGAMPQGGAISINIPENLGESITNAIAPAIHGAVNNGMTQALSAYKPPQPTAMKRTAVRGPDGLIMHTIDEPMPPAPTPAMVN